jgi:cytochrome bd-type quinol oxidase subunit 2
MRGWELAAVLSSSAFLFGMLATTMIGNYPFWLRSTIHPSFSLTAANTVSARYGMALAWWVFGAALAIGYFTYLFRSMRGKVGTDRGESYTPGYVTHEDMHQSSAILPRRLALAKP